MRELAKALGDSGRSRLPATLQKTQPTRTVRPPDPKILAPSSTASEMKCVDVGFSGEGFRLAPWASAKAMGSVWAFFEGLIH